MNKFRCQACHQEYETETTEADRVAEYATRFPGADPAEAVSVCHECWLRLTPDGMANPPPDWTITEDDTVEWTIMDVLADLDDWPPPRLTIWLRH